MTPRVELVVDGARALLVVAVLHVIMVFLVSLNDVLVVVVVVVGVPVVEVEVEASTLSMP